MFFYPELSSLKTTRHMAGHEVLGELFAMFKQSRAKRLERQAERRAAENEIEPRHALQVSML